MKSGVGNLSLKHMNIGAGDLHHLVDGYLHLDACYTDNFLLQHEHNQNTGVIRCDVVTQLPRLPGIEVIYTCHLLEHLTLDEGYVFLQNCFNLLKPGGTIRICVPDFDIWYNSFKNGDKEFFDYYRSQMPYPLSERYNNDYAFMTTMMYGHGHRMIYTYEYLCQVLSDIGFNDITKKSWGDSSILNIDKLEDVNNQLRAKESLIVEATK
jgi:predicted SAM-dependent methyltransferase